MADTKITDLTAITSGVASTDVTVLVDVSDTSMAASGTNKKISVGDLATAIVSAGSIATDAEVTAAVAAHTGDTSAAHAASAISFSATGSIAATDVQAAVAEVATDAATALSTHEADTTSVHGIADTSALETTTGSASKVSTHAALTSSVHGISAFGASLVDDADASAARTTLGLGSLATASTITSSSVTDFAETARDTIGTALVAGSNVTITVNDGADTITIAASGGGGAGILPLANNSGFHQYTAPGLFRISFVEPIITLASGTTYYFGPYQLFGTTGIDRVQFKANTVTNANVRIAFIAMNTSTWQPSSLTYAIAEQNYTTTGEKIITFTSQSLAAGAYFIGMRADASIGIAGMRMQSVSGWRGYEEGFSNTSHYTVSEAYGAFASTPTAWTTVAVQGTSGSSGLVIPVMWGIA